MDPDRLPLVMFLLVGLVVVAVIGLATGSWLWFGVALAVHVIASAIVIPGAVRSAQTGTEADERSQALDREAGQAVRGEPRTVESELEALKRE
jgi:membrane protein implicated in regulation of membrane protease activity